MAVGVDVGGIAVALGRTAVAASGATTTSAGLSGACAAAVAVGRFRVVSVSYGRDSHR